MSMTDPIADFLARIRNGIRARKQLVELPRSNVKLRIAEILRDEGFVNSVSSAEDKKQGVLKVELRYDGRGNFTMGVREQIIFPEIEYDKIDSIKGLNISIVTTAKTDAEGRALLAHLGMPFRQPAPAIPGAPATGAAA